MAMSFWEKVSNLRNAEIKRVGERDLQFVESLLQDKNDSNAEEKLKELFQYFFSCVSNRSPADDDTRNYLVFYYKLWEDASESEQTNEIEEQLGLLQVAQKWADQGIDIQKMETDNFCANFWMINAAIKIRFETSRCLTAVLAQPIWTRIENAFWIASAKLQRKRLITISLQLKHK